MRIAIIADGRAEHFRRWIRYFLKTGDEILLLSTYPCVSEKTDGQYHILPGLFRSGDTLVKRSDGNTSTHPNLILRLILRTDAGKWLFPPWHQAKVLDVLAQTVAARRALAQFQPHIIQAMRLQNEGYIAAFTKHRPVVLHLWGSDLAYFACRYPLHRWLTKPTLKSLNGLMADCQRDIRLARKDGLPDDIPARLFPNNGGVDFTIFQPGIRARQRERWIVYPRGLAPYIRLDTLLRAIQILRHRNEDAGTIKLLVPSAVMKIADSLVRDFGLSTSAVEVLPFMDERSLAALLQRAAVIVSPSLTDGTPNSMLEAMACGAFPVMSNLESIREWITHGENGFLFDPNDASALAMCLMQAMDDWKLREKAQAINLQLVRERADYSKVMPQVREFYREIAKLS